MRHEAVIYHCDVCSRGIKATASDPVHKPGSRTLCTRCLHFPTGAIVVPNGTIVMPNGPRDSGTPVAPPKVDGRRAARKAWWAAMTPEQQRAHVAKMQAARKKPIIEVS